MASRAYKRDSRGRFAGGGGAVTTTYGRAGGFASASHRAKAANARASKARRRALVRRGVRVAANTAGVGLALAGPGMVGSIGRKRKLRSKASNRSALTAYRTIIGEVVSVVDG